MFNTNPSVVFRCSTTKKIKKTKFNIEFHSRAFEFKDGFTISDLANFGRISINELNFSLSKSKPRLEINDDIRPGKANEPKSYDWNVVYYVTCDQLMAAKSEVDFQLIHNRLRESDALMNVDISVVPEKPKKLKASKFKKPYKRDRGAMQMHI